MRRLRLDRLVAQRWPEWGESQVSGEIAAGNILVDGAVITNPASQVSPDASIRHTPPSDLAGTRKMGWAVAHFGVACAGRVALDVGASAGGFTRALLDAGARLVYAVDVGHGQLVGSLRQDPRVVNLERTNVSALSVALVPTPAGIVTVDVSYLSLSAAVAQIPATVREPGAELVGLVKPMFELRLPTIPTSPGALEQARDAAVDGVTSAGWTVRAVAECPVRGGRGAIEFMLHASST